VLSKDFIAFIRVKAKLHVAAAANDDDDDDDDDDDNNKLNTFLERHSKPTNTLTFYSCADTMQFLPRLVALPQRM